MYEEDFYDPQFDEEHEREQLNIMNQIKNVDKGFNTVYRKYINHDGISRVTKINVYTSSGKGSNIRDGETGIYYPNLVGSKDEDLFFKVNLATGECVSKNNSNTLFFMSPRHYETHMRTQLDISTITQWQDKCTKRMRELKYQKKYVINNNNVIVK